MGQPGLFPEPDTTALAEMGIERLERLDAGVPPFDLIYADPPWRYASGTTTPTRQIERQYPTMTTYEIATLPVQGRCRKDCVLFLWATNPLLPDALQVMECWGFTYKTNFAWVKDKIGLGHWCRQQHELLLVGTCGSPPTPATEHRIPSVLMAPRGSHSKKPERVAKVLEETWPDYRRLELFSRSPRPGWSVWGDEA